MKEKKVIFSAFCVEVEKKRSSPPFLSSAPSEAVLIHLLLLFLFLFPLLYHVIEPRLAPSPLHARLSLNIFIVISLQKSNLLFNFN